MCLNILLLCNFIIVFCGKYIILDFYILNFLTIKEIIINVRSIQVGPKYTLAPPPKFQAGPWPLPPIPPPMDLSIHHTHFIACIMYIMTT